MQTSLPRLGGTSAIILGSRLIVAGMLAVALWIFWVEYVAPPAWPDAYVASAPLQESFSSAPTPWQFNDHTVTPVARFSVEALVLSRTHYATGREARFSEIDLALGWGPMSDPAVLSELKIWQSGRWYFYRWQNPPPVAPFVIQSHSSNFHTVPANDEIGAQLRSVQRGDIVTLYGYLINIRGADGWNWKSSLSRTDTGNGACELLWVEQMNIRRP